MVDYLNPGDYFAEGPAGTIGRTNGIMAGTLVGQQVNAPRPPVTPGAVPQPPPINAAQAFPGGIPTSQITQQSQSAIQRMRSGTFDPSSKTTANIRAMNQVKAQQQAAAEQARLDAKGKADAAQRLAWEQAKAAPGVAKAALGAQALEEKKREFDATSAMKKEQFAATQKLRQDLQNQSQEAAMNKVKAMGLVPGTPEADAKIKQEVTKALAIEEAKAKKSMDLAKTQNEFKQEQSRYTATLQLQNEQYKEQLKQTEMKKPVDVSKAAPVPEAAQPEKKVSQEDYNQAALITERPDYKTAYTPAERFFIESQLSAWKKQNK